MSERPPQRQRQRQRRLRSRHEDTVVAYHSYLQTLIKDRLNSLNLGPGKVPFRVAMILYVWGLACAVVGILIIGLRSRHVYLTGIWTRFVGPLFIIFFLLSFGAATYFLNDAKRKSNKYRRNLRFQALGQFGVKVVHTTRLPHEKILREEYKTGTTTHVNAKPPQQHKAYAHRYGQSNRGYNSENGHDYGREYGHQYGERYAAVPPAHAGQSSHAGPPAGPPDIVPGRPRQYKSRVVIQQQREQQRERSHAAEAEHDDSSV